MIRDKKKSSWILYMGTYPPRECGIATFTQDLSAAMDKEFSPRFRSKIIAMDNDLSKNFSYPKDVIFRIKDTQIKDYSDVAKKINKIKAIKLVNIQHEYGIFGGKEGDFLLEFLKNVKKPIVVTFHTVLDNPSPLRKKVTQEIVNKCRAVVVIINKAKDVLKKEYGADKNKIFVMPHGIHPVGFRHPPKVKNFFNTQNKIILSTFGLLGGKSKGLGYVIDALPQVIRKHPNVVYAILGATHPDVLRANKGEILNELKIKIKKLRLEKNVRFYNRHLPLKELLIALNETDIYLTPYIQKDRKSSGTLAYAMGCGRACISTPFYFAEDIIKNGKNGILVDFKDSKGIANAINQILDNLNLKANLEKGAYDQTRHMTWPNIAKDYYQIYKGILG